MPRMPHFYGQSMFRRAAPGVVFCLILGTVLRLSGVDASIRPGGDEELYYPYTGAIAGRISAGTAGPAGHFAHPPLSQIVMGISAAISGIEQRSSTLEEAETPDLPPRFVYGDGTELLAVVRRPDADPRDAIDQIEPRLPAYERPAGDSAWKSLGDYAMERIAAGERFLFLIPNLPGYRDRYIDLPSWRVEPVKVVAEKREIRLLFADDSEALIIEIEAEIRGAIAVSRPARGGPGSVALWATTADGQTSIIQMDIENGGSLPQSRVMDPGSFGGRLTQIASGYGETMARRDDGAVVLLNTLGQAMAATDAPSGTIADAQLGEDGRARWVLRTDDGRSYTLTPAVLSGARLGSALFGAVGIIVAALGAAIAGGSVAVILLSALFVAIDPAGVIAGRTLLVDGPAGVAIGVALVTALAWWRGRLRSRRAAFVAGAGLGLVIGAKLALWSIAPLVVAALAASLPRGPRAVAMITAAVVVAAAANALFFVPGGPWGPVVVAGAAVIALRRMRDWPERLAPTRILLPIAAGATAAIGVIYGFFMILSGVSLPDAVTAYRDGVLYQVTVRGDYESQWWGWPFGYGLMELRTADLNAEIFTLSPAIGLIAVIGVIAYRRLHVPVLIAATAFGVWAGWGVLTRFALTSNAAHLSIPFALVAAFAAVSIINDRRAIVGALLAALVASPPAMELGGAHPLIVGVALLAAIAIGVVAGGRAPQIPGVVSGALIALSMALPRLAALDGPVGAGAFVAVAVAGWSGGSLIRSRRGDELIGIVVAISSLATLPMAIGVGGEIPSRLERIEISPSLIDALATGPSFRDGAVAPIWMPILGAVLGLVLIAFRDRRVAPSAPLRRWIRGRIARSLQRRLSERSRQGSRRRA